MNLINLISINKMKIMTKMKKKKRKVKMRKVLMMSAASMERWYLNLGDPKKIKNFKNLKLKSTFEFQNFTIKISKTLNSQVKEFQIFKNQPKKK